jgi:hypothetical protein
MNNKIKQEIKIISFKQNIKENFKNLFFQIMNNI